MNEQLERFEIFWKAYPRKVGKGAVRKIWLRKKFSDETLNEMLETLKWQVKLEQWKNKQFIPHPSTWLNQERWEDEYDSELIEKPLKKSEKDILLEIMAEKKRKMGIIK